MKKIIIILFLIYIGGYAQEIQDTTASDVGIRPTWLWAGAQLIPSPQWLITEDDGSRFGLRWQVTPLLYSFGLNRRVSPWRSLVAEPMARYNGSIELFASPEYLPNFQKKWLLRAGIRAYMPLYQYGEYLATSIGTSYYTYDNQSGISYEAGLYIFFGLLGIQATYSPGFDKSKWTFTLNIRYF